MVQIAALTLLAIAASSVNAIPVHLNKRIAQVIAEATSKWEQACIAAGGADKCNPVSVAAFSTLLAAPASCEQQDAADSMIDLAKTLNNNANMITLAQIFAQQPRNTPNSLSVPYCQKAPKNAELNGLFQCQFQGANLNTFVGGVAVGGQGTIPFGQNAPLSPLGSCPANPGGPIPGGVQLHTLTNNPGKVGGGNSNQQAPPPPAQTAPPPPAQTAAPPAQTAPPAVPAPAPSPAQPAGGNAGGNFRLLNGQDAQKLNAKFATLTADSACTAGENACVGGGFAQCVGGKFVTTTCGTLKCFALPLVNSRGTSITCDTEADAIARIAASGATGGLTGTGGGATPETSTPPPANNGGAAPAPAPAPASPAPAPAGGDFRAQNGRDAQALNAKFQNLSKDTACTSGENACIGSDFAQCVNGKFVTTTCGALQCVALPLVNKPGTSITCDTEADAIARINASGATGGLRG